MEIITLPFFFPSLALRKPEKGLKNPKPSAFSLNYGVGVGEGTAWLLFCAAPAFLGGCSCPGMVQARILFCFSGFPPLLATFRSNFILGFGELVGIWAKFCEEFIVWVMSGFQIRGLGSARSKGRCQGKTGAPKMGRGSVGTLEEEGILDFGEIFQLFL